MFCYISSSPVYTRVRVWISCLSNTKSLSRCITAVCARVQRRCWIRPNLQHNEDRPNLTTHNGAVRVNTHPAYMLRCLHCHRPATVTCDGYMNPYTLKQRQRPRVCVCVCVRACVCVCVCWLKGLVGLLKLNV